ncbi:hypothetical protein BGW36DRAFT_303708 [Talaromyces proteolyticus]|uniref:Uncharacterized protein n=1 Tax=Talaromyces proteolyticus TaxID=1131652 RepID=A0AAD4KME0_9EURO|nr:uncharacterized protein BGW36DRAFT_303708 [Talaromyces proteolyticus]KAH8692421.1 hypothetical protein BGW36DRAFT_303708 [Talaromyces proteolyticus]
MQTDSTANSLPSTSSSNRTRRRPEVTAWIREPARKRNASNRVRRSYRKALKDPAVRKHLVISVILGFLLISTIAMYLAFALASDTFQGQQFHVLIILFIIILAIVFCHSVARTCMLATRFARYGTTLHRVPSVVGPRGYAQPAEPIHVILARDEEIAEQDQTSPGQTKVTPPPPAYGLWRNSVRIDPNMIHWQRVEAAKARKANRSETPEPNTANRPPSYISENGVDYVIEAQPRSTVSHQKELTT